VAIPGDLERNPFPDTKWGVDDKPVLVLDGTLFRADQLRSPLHGLCAYVVGISDKHFPALCEHLEVERLQFYEMRVADLGPLARMQSLQGLALRWNTKARDLAAVGALRHLRALVLDDTRHLQDLAALRPLQHLERLEFYGGVWSPNTALTLAPLADLPRLRELKLLNLKIKEGGLQTLAGCAALRTLQLSNQFPTEDYACLSVRLPQAECGMFEPYRRLSSPIGGKDTMVVGKGKPLLDSKADASRLARYVREFRQLQERFARPAGGDIAKM
jgi:hypothetical protein